MARTVTCKEIAEMVGVSRQACASVLNDSPVCHVSQEKRLEILEIARRMHYRPNYAARMLSGVKPKIVGCIFDMPTGSGATQLDEFSRVMYLAGYTVEYVNFTGSVRSHKILDHFISSGVEGIVVPSYIMKEVRHEDYPVPFLITGNDSDEIRYNYEQGAELAVNHLVKEHGHNEIILLMTELLFSNADIARGYHAAMTKRGFKTIQPIELIGNSHFEKDLLDIVKKKKRIAFLSTSEDIAFRLIGFLRERGIDVPGQVSVMSFGCSSHYQNISYVCFPRMETGRQMAKTMLYKIENNIIGKLEPPVRVDMSLYLAGSCGCPSRRIHCIFPEYIEPLISESTYQIKEET